MSVRFMVASRRLPALGVTERLHDAVGTCAMDGAERLTHPSPILPDAARGADLSLARARATREGVESPGRRARTWVARARAAGGSHEDSARIMTGRRALENERLEAKLRAQIQEVSATERRLNDVLEGVELLAVSTDLDGRIRFCNRFMCELTGWAREDLLGRSWAETFNPESTIVEQMAAGRVFDHEEAPLRTRSGEPREIAWSTTLDRDADGRITGATGIGQDVTERNRAAADLRLLAREQAALRRVATCVASEADPSSVFDIVAEEVGRLLGGRAANVVRFEPDVDAGKMVGGWSRHFRSLPVGSRVEFDGPTALGLVRHSRRSARVDDYSPIPGEFAALIRKLGIHASVAAPISVGGELWGAIVVSTTRDAPLA